MAFEWGIYRRVEGIQDNIKKTERKRQSICTQPSYTCKSLFYRGGGSWRNWMSDSTRNAIMLHGSGLLVGNVIKITYDAPHRGGKSVSDKILFAITNMYLCPKHYSRILFLQNWNSRLQTRPRMTLRSELTNTLKYQKFFIFK